MAGLAAWLHSRGPAITDDERARAQRAGVPAEAYVTMIAYNRNRKGTQMDERDWKVVRSVFEGGNEQGKAEALAAMRGAARRSSYRADAAQCAKSFLASHPKTGRVAAIQVLRNADDPAWKAAAQRLANDPDKEEAALGKGLLGTP